MNKEDKYLTIPNILTVLRIIILPFVLYYIIIDMQGNRLIIFSLLGVQGATDFLDGAVARKFKQVSSFGKILDPLVDKLTFDSVMLALIKYEFPVFLAVLLITRDIVIIISGYFIFKKKNVIPVSNIWGKITTFSLVVYLISFIAGWEVMKNIFLYTLIVAICFSGISYAIYFIKLKIRGENE